MFSLYKLNLEAHATTRGYSTKTSIWLCSSQQDRRIISVTKLEPVYEALSKSVEFNKGILVAKPL